MGTFPRKGAEVISRSNLIHNPSLLMEKATGALVGLAVGDALGDTGRQDVFRNRYGIVTNLYDGTRGTDDTEFAVLTARALIDFGGDLTLDRAADAWRKHILDQGGVYKRAGSSLYGAAENLRRGILPPQSGMDNVMNNDDGAAMRATPVGICCAGQPERAAALAAVDAQVSHAEDGVSAAQAIAAAVSVAMVDASVEEIFQAAVQHIPENSWLGRSMQHCCELCRSASGIEDVWQSLHDDFWTPVHSVSAEAIPQALAIFRLTGGDFQRGLFWAGNFGRDADTIAAIVGALNGARLGISVIPGDWVARVSQPAGVCLRFSAQENLIDLAAGLVDLIIRQESDRVSIEMKGGHPNS
jgi:ADP-ribosylglycohydrolase